MWGLCQGWSRAGAAWGGSGASIGTRPPAHASPGGSDFDTLMCQAVNSRLVAVWPLCCALGGPCTAAGPSSDCPLTSPAGPCLLVLGELRSALARRQEVWIPCTNVMEHLPAVFIRRGCREAAVRGGCLCDRSQSQLRQAGEVVCFLPQTCAAHSTWPGQRVLSAQSRTVQRFRASRCRPDAPSPDSSSPGRRRKSSEAQQGPVLRAVTQVLPAAAWRGCGLARSMPQQASQAWTQRPEGSSPDFLFPVQGLIWTRLREPGPGSPSPVPLLACPHLRSVSWLLLSRL